LRRMRQPHPMMVSRTSSFSSAGDVLTVAGNSAETSASIGVACGRHLFVAEIVDGGPLRPARLNRLPRGSMHGASDELFARPRNTGHVSGGDVGVIGGAMCSVWGGDNFDIDGGSDDDSDGPISEVEEEAPQPKYDVWCREDAYFSESDEDDDGDSCADRVVDAPTRQPSIIHGCRGAEGGDCFYDCGGCEREARIAPRGNGSAQPMWKVWDRPDFGLAGGHCGGGGREVQPPGSPLTADSHDRIRAHGAGLNRGRGGAARRLTPLE